ncbi:DUF3892 domain-containing protein [Parasphingorhabdus sp. DH2-15]|uniref:DUF3892 domain-containing protein n=1 Tax=Parasphingorhabdus sp. DH2-15 TaxID=3444112 RepID=UPI003F6880B2
MTKEVIDAKANSDGNITHVKLSGNKSYTPLDTAMKMADKGQISNARSVRPRNGAKDHLRTNPDGKKGNNLDNMTGDN